jgi:hypothetical protein
MKMLSEMSFQKRNCYITPEEIDNVYHSMKKLKEISEILEEKGRKNGDIQGNDDSPKYEITIEKPNKDFLIKNNTHYRSLFV